jgi:hypothetical protein
MAFFWELSKAVSILYGLSTPYAAVGNVETKSTFPFQRVVRRGWIVLCSVSYDLGNS